MKKYGNWKESEWFSAEVNLAEKKKITVGIDVGTVSTEAVAMMDEKIIGYSIIHSAMDYAEAPKKVLESLMKGLNLQQKDIDDIVCTGFGHKNVPLASKYVDEITCHAKGARYMFGPTVTTVVDLGGQTCKAIRLHKWDRVRDFMVNDKCATGMGHNIEEICELLEVNIDEIGSKSLSVEKEPEPVSTTCFTFAQTETMGLFHPGFREDPLKENEVYASHMFAVAWRILGIIGRLQPLDVGDISVYPELAFTGGMAKNVGITKRLEEHLKITALASEWDPMLAGAIGAAILAREIR